MTKQLKVDSVVNVAGSGKPNFPVSPTSGGAALSTLNTHSYTSSGTEPSSPKNGAIWWDSGNSKVYVYANGEFKEITLNTDYPVAAPAWSGDRGVITGESFTNYEIQYFNIASSGNAADFGNLSVTRGFKLGSCGSSTRGTFGGGYSSGTRRDEIDYITHSSTGNATDFGNLSIARSYGSACANGTRGLYAGGINAAGSYVNTVDYITIANTGNATDFGDMSGVNSGRLGSGNDATRAVFGGGLGGGASNTIDYFTFASAGNATDFGNFLSTQADLQGCSDATRIVFGGNAGGSNVLQYLTTQSAGNATDFGDLTVNLDGAAGVANLLKGVFAGGITPSNPANNMEVITIQTTGNATDHGDLAEAQSYPVACSGAAS